MDDQKLRQIIRQEIQANSSAARFALNPIQRHTHNDIDSPPVKYTDLLRSTPVSGNITMAQATTYTIGLGVSAVPATSVLFNGVVTYNSGGGITARVHCIGTANLGNSFYLQPDSSTSVKVGGPQQDLIQSSSMFLIDSTGSPPVVRALSDEGHIIDVEYSGSVVARATITSFSRSSIVVEVVTLVSGWTISGNWVIT